MNDSGQVCVHERAYVFGLFGKLSHDSSSRVVFGHYRFRSGAEALLEAHRFGVSETAKVYDSALASAVGTMQKFKRLLSLGPKDFDTLSESDAFDVYELFVRAAWIDPCVGDALLDKEWPDAVNPKLAVVFQDIVKATPLHARLVEELQLQLRSIYGQW